MLFLSVARKSSRQLAKSPLGALKMEDGEENPREDVEPAAKGPLDSLRPLLRLFSVFLSNPFSVSRRGGVFVARVTLLRCLLCQAFLVLVSTVTSVMFLIVLDRGYSILHAFKVT